MTTDTYLERLAALAGIRIEYALLPPDRDGEYRHKHRTIRLRRGMSSRLHRSVLAHELAHAFYADEPTHFGPVHAKQERRANEWAAQRLIHHDDYRRAEELHEGHAGGMATELGVVVSVVEAYRDILLRVENAVYVRPRMGAGMWDHREDVA